MNTKTSEGIKSISDHPIVSREEWVKARKELLKEEKEFTRLRDRLSQERRDLPWVRVEKEYIFDSPKGKETLADLFEERSQLVVYHFMFAPDWDEGCPHCSFWADNFNGIGMHLNHRDVTMVAISRAPLAKLEAFKKRMGWSFKWVSSFDSDFNYDYGVSFTPKQVANGETIYNYGTGKPYGPDAVGISVFYREHDDAVFHTYSCYSRGADMLNGAYHYLDLAPLGRDEGDQGQNPQAWVHRHDEYQD